MAEDLLERSAFAALALHSDEHNAVAVVDALLRRAVAERASDVHFETQGESVWIRMRVDGILRRIETFDGRLGARCISRVKLLAAMDIAERRLPQDGRITWQDGSRPIDIRVASLPAQAGERLALRLFDIEAVPLTLAQLGMPEDVASGVRRILDRSDGLFIVAGPTGSGKTTTLYAALALLDGETRHICTVEDPVERRMAGCSQVAINTRSGLTFAIALRAILRQDPDIVMIGEIRDEETAQTAVHAALTGRLVLASVHGAGTSGAIERLRELGVRDSALQAVLRAVLGQRLMRKPCGSCEAKGPCDVCEGTGYRGRQALFDLRTGFDLLGRAGAAND